MTIIAIEDLVTVAGGCGASTSTSSRLRCGPPRPQTPGNYNTGITGGLGLPNSQVPVPRCGPPRSFIPELNTSVSGGVGASDLGSASITDSRPGA